MGLVTLIFDLSTLKLVSNVGDLPFKFRHAGPLCSRIIRYVRDGRTDGQKQRLLPLPYGGGAIIISEKSTHRAKIPPWPKRQPKVTRDSNPDFRINPNPYPDVCRITRKIMWIHCLINVSHFAEFRKNRRDLREMVRHLLNSPFPQRWIKRKSDPESTWGSGSTPKFNHF